jgi:hypothetical protein
VPQATGIRKKAFFVEPSGDIGGSHRLRRSVSAKNAKNAKTQRRKTERREEANIFNCFLLLLLLRDLCVFEIFAFPRTVQTKRPSSVGTREKGQAATIQ